MTVKLAGGALATVLVLAALVFFGQRVLAPDAHSGSTSPAPAPVVDAAPSAPGPTQPPPAAEAHPGFLYGRITTVEGATYEGRLRWGQEVPQEAFWGDYFNGAKEGNPWTVHVAPERLPREDRSISLFGVEIVPREARVAVDRLFMSRFGDIARIESGGREVRVTLKSGTVFALDRMEAGDFDDGVRVWDSRGEVGLDSLRIRAIEFLSAPAPGPVPSRLHGTVHTAQGDFRGFLQWDREECVGTDELNGRSAEGQKDLPFETIRSIARPSPDSARVTLLDGREIVLSGTHDVGRGHRGIYVDDARYGRVLIPWEVFESVDFTPGGSGPAYGDFPPGVPLTGRVTTRAGDRLAGRLVFDLDESETTETLDAPSGGVDYTLPFGLVASIALEEGSPHARVGLRTGEELALERSGDLGEGNAGLLVFVEGGPHPDYVPWAEVARIDLDRPR